MPLTPEQILALVDQEERRDPSLPPDEAKRQAAVNQALTATDPDATFIGPDPRSANERAASEVDARREDARANGDLAGYAATLPVGKQVADVVTGLGTGVRDLGQVGAFLGRVAGSDSADAAATEMAQQSEAENARQAAIDSEALGVSPGRVIRGLARIAGNSVLPAAGAGTVIRGVGVGATTAARLAGVGLGMGVGGAQADETAKAEGLTGADRFLYTAGSAVAQGLPNALFAGGAEVLAQGQQAAKELISEGVRKAFLVGAGEELAENEVSEIAQRVLDRVALPSQANVPVKDVIADYLRTLPERALIAGAAGGIPHAFHELGKPTLDQVMPAPSDAVTNAATLDAMRPGRQRPEDRPLTVRDLPRTFDPAAEAQRIIDEAGTRAEDLASQEQGEPDVRAAQADESIAGDRQAAERRRALLERRLAEARAQDELATEADRARGENATAEADRIAEETRADHPEELNPEVALAIEEHLREQMRAGTTSEAMRKRIEALANGLGTVETVRHEDPTGQAADQEVVGFERPITSNVGPNHHQERIGLTPFVERFQKRYGPANLGSLRNAIDRAARGEPITGRTYGEEYLLDHALHGLTENPEDQGPPDKLMEDLRRYREQQGTVAPPDRARGGRPAPARDLASVDEPARGMVPDFAPPAKPEEPAKPPRPYEASPTPAAVADAEEAATRTTGEHHGQVEAQAEGQAAPDAPPRVLNRTAGTPDTRERPPGGRSSGKGVPASEPSPTADELRNRFREVGRRMGQGDEYGDAAFELIKARAKSAGVSPDEYVRRRFRGRGVEVDDAQGPPSMNQKGEPANPLDTREFAGRRRAIKVDSQEASTRAVGMDKQAVAKFTEDIGPAGSRLLHPDGRTFEVRANKDGKKYLAPIDPETGKPLRVDSDGDAMGALSPYAAIMGPDRQGIEWKRVEEKRAESDVSELDQAERVPTTSRLPLNRPESLRARRDAFRRGETERPADPNAETGRHPAIGPDELHQSAARDGDMPGQQSIDTTPPAAPKQPGPLWTTKTAELLRDPKFPTKASGDTMLAFLKNKGVNDREVFWLGLDKLAGQKVVTRDDVMALAKPPKLVEVLHEEPTPENQQARRDALARARSAYNAAKDRHGDVAETFHHVAASLGKSQTDRANLALSLTDHEAVDNFINDNDVLRKTGHELVDARTAADRAQRTLRNLEQAGEPEGTVRFGTGDLVLPGGKNQRELIITLPGAASKQDPSGWKLGAKIMATDGTEQHVLDESGRAWTPFYVAHRTPENTNRSTYVAIESGEDLAEFGTAEEALDFIKSYAKDNHRGKPAFTAPGHWPGIDNPLLHMRFNDRTDADGKRVLHIEEIQSDWHQAGRDKGYQGTFKATVAHEPATRSAEEPFPWATRIGQDNEVVSRHRTEEDARRAVPELEAKWNANNGVPNAPFAKTWEEVGLRRMIRWAAEHGYERVTWTTGDQQNERYSLAKRVRKIEWTPNQEPLTAPRPSTDGWLTIVGTDGGSLIDESATHQRVVDLVGKEVAERLMQAPEVTRNNGRIKSRILQGDGLSIGGEGMRAAYDQRIPSAAKAIAKKFDSRVGTTKVETSESNRNSATFEVVDENGESRGFYRTRREAEQEIHNLAETAVEQNIGTRYTGRDVSDEAARYEIINRARNGAGDAQTVHYLDMSPKLVESALNGQPLLFQRDKLNKTQADVARGSVNFADPEGAQRALIRILRTANESTLLHEIGHVFRRDLTGEDLAVVERWAGVKDGKWTRRAEEKWADGWERYLRDGYAPTPELKSVFQRFAAWMRKVYATIKGTALEDALPADVRKVMDRLLTPGAIPLGPDTVMERADAGRAGRAGSGDGGASPAGAADPDLARSAPAAPVRVAPAAPVVEARRNGAPADGRPVDRTVPREAPARDAAADGPLTERNPGELANYGTSEPVRERARNLDAERDLPVRTHAAVHAEADDRLAKDYAGAKRAVFEKAKVGEMLTDVETVMAQKILDREGRQAIAHGSPTAMLEQATLHAAFRNVRTEQARALAAGRDRSETRQQRIARVATSALYTPPVRFAVAIKQAQKAVSLARERGHGVEAAQKRLDLQLRRAAKHLEQVRTYLRKVGADVLYQGDDLDQALALVNHAAQANRTWGGILREYWVNSLLSGFKTISTNAAAANAVWKVTGARWTEAAVNLLLRKPDAATFGELRHMYRALLDPRTWQQAGRNAIRSFIAERPVFGDELQEDETRLDPGYGPQIRGRLGKFIRTPTRTLLLADQFNKTWSAHVEVAAQAYRLARVAGLKPGTEEFHERMMAEIGDPDSEAWNKAKDMAREWAFQAPPGELGKGIQKIRDWKLPGTDIRPLFHVLPFLNTPSNILKEGTSQTVVGSPLNLLYKWSAARNGAMEWTGERQVIDTAKLVIAFALQGLALGLAFQDDEDGTPILTGSDGYDGPGENETEQRTGTRPYTIKLFGTRWHYGKVEPVATALGAAADIAHAIRKQAKGGKVADLIDNLKDAVIGQAFEKSALTGMSDMFEAVQHGQGTTGKLTRWASSFATSWIPNVIRQPGQQIDPLVRDSHTRPDDTREWWWNAGERLKRTVMPWTRPPKISVWGDEINKTDSAPASDVVFRVLRTLAPVDANTPRPPSELDRLILNWNNDPTHKPFYPPPASQKYVSSDKIPREMTDVQFDRYARAAGKRAVEILLGKELNVDNPTPRDIKIIKGALSRARRAARIELLSETTSSEDDEDLSADN